MRPPVKPQTPKQTARQVALLGRVVSEMNARGVAAPKPLDLARALGTPIQAIEGILEVGMREGRVVKVAKNLFYSVDTLIEAETRLSAAFGAGDFTVAQAKEALATTRKYALPLLEHFDATGVTVRSGDQRRVKS